MYDPFLGTIDRFGQSSALDPIELCSVLTSAMKGEHIDDGDRNIQSALHLAAQRGATICCVHLLQQVNRIDPPNES